MVPPQAFENCALAVGAETVATVNANPAALKPRATIDAIRYVIGGAGSTVRTAFLNAVAELATALAATTCLFDALGLARTRQGEVLYPCNELSHPRHDRPSGLDRFGHAPGYGRLGQVKLA